MPQVILLAALGAGLYAGIRALSRAGHQLAADLQRREEAVRQTARAPSMRGEKNGGTLEFDPVSGVYKPAISRD